MLQTFGRKSTRKASWNKIHGLKEVEIISNNCNKKNYLEWKKTNPKRSYFGKTRLQTHQEQESAFSNRKEIMEVTFKGVSGFALCAICTLILKFCLKVSRFALLPFFVRLHCETCAGTLNRNTTPGVLTTESSSHWLHDNHKQGITNKRLFLLQVSKTLSSLPILLLTNFIQNKISLSANFRASSADLHWVVTTTHLGSFSMTIGMNSQWKGVSWGAAMWTDPHKQAPRFTPWSWYHHSHAFQLCSLLIL